MKECKLRAFEAWSGGLQLTLCLQQSVMTACAHMLKAARLRELCLAVGDIGLQQYAAQDKIEAAFAMHGLRQCSQCSLCGDLWFKLGLALWCKLEVF